MSLSELPPEVLFHRFFQECRSPGFREKYQGKQNLDRVPEPRLRSALTEIQLALNFSLAHSRETMPTLNSRVLHFDYVEAKVPNALAFQYHGYDFIGVTMPLVDQLLQTCERLSRSARLADFLELVATNEQQESTQAGLFMAQLTFVAAHEFGHHAFGHTSWNGTDLWNDVLDGNAIGSLEDQAREAVADGYAVYLLLDLFIVSQQRRRILELFGHQEAPETGADQILLSAFLLGAGAFFFVRSPAIIATGESIH